jgi:hypothetical protein
MALAQRALGGLAHAREAFGQQVVDRLAVLAALAQRSEAPRQLLIGQTLELGFERIDARDRRPQALDQPIVRRAEDLARESPNVRLRMPGARV